jgi:hypothetical protein
MGGFGSGRWGFNSKADTVEDCRGLDVRFLARQGALVPWYQGTVRWTRHEREIASIGFTTRPSMDAGLTLVLNYRITRSGEGAFEDIEMPVALETTRPHLGGIRWWARCALVVNNRPCQRRVAILYLPPGGRYFGCRHCYRLTYRSAQEHDKRVDWLRRNSHLIPAILENETGLTDGRLLLALKAMDGPDRSTNRARTRRRRF